VKFNTAVSIQYPSLIEEGEAGCVWE